MQIYANVENFKNVDVVEFASENEHQSLLRVFLLALSLRNYSEICVKSTEFDLS